MSLATEDRTANMVRHDLEALRGHWASYLAIGIVLIVLGVLALVASFVATLATVTLLGALLTLAGISQVIGAFWARQWSGFLTLVLLGILYVVVGLIALDHPVWFAGELTLLIAVFLIFGGTLRIVSALAAHHANSGWVLLNGAITLLLGLMIWRELPGSALWVIGTFTGVELVLNGWTWVALALAFQRSSPAHGLSVKSESKRHVRTMRGLKIVGALLLLWFLAAYMILPALWRHYEHAPALASAPKTTLTGQGIPGDPLNVGLIGTEADVIRSMQAAGWSSAVPLSLRSDVRIAGSVLFKWPDSDAPVSSLFLFGRKQDLAFERPVNNNARRRHHVRFWKSDDLGRDGVPLFIGATTYDASVGFSHDTAQFTHHIDPDIDAQRDQLVSDLTSAGRITKLFQVTGVGATLNGRNGEGDRYYTDGEVTIGVLAVGANATEAPDRLANPPLVQIKNQLWSAIRPILQGTSQ